MDSTEAFFNTSISTFKYLIGFPSITFPRNSTVYTLSYSLSDIGQLMRQTKSFNSIPTCSLKKLRAVRLLKRWNPFFLSLTCQLNDSGGSPR